MTNIVLASNNTKKIEELQVLFSSSLGNCVKVLSLADIGYYKNIEEYGSTFEENSLIKAAVPASLGYIGVADDSGLCDDALGGAPGIYSARYSGEDATDADNRKKLLFEMRDVPDDKRTASFVCVVSVVLPERMGIIVPEKDRALGKYANVAEVKPELSSNVRGECSGIILRSEAGNGGFGYDNLFYSEELGKTFAQASGSEKNAVSHRGRAIREFVGLIKRIIE